ncbi:hypothetical protein FD04_GL001810 [Secundilactobacillus odoratitofui DSM 19909 = JCM 15043]|uniref:Uncharacterized protein n=1 Tax=Secundilactobacillus odoratitofui DSM 19909 = JCM 15043 TaxID=1423776 RepID=A0A0R1LWZ4_9LACO|nr:hypothetical protein [Secundilactobacillus odoratitofui]KRK96954.1 hypothetical protein FD04_GL001810 [Secundilactobacillus odoratitofui DSM 19909 = JCM 15043]
MKKSENEIRQNVIIDMNDFLLEYGTKKLGHRDDLAEVIYQAAKDDLHGLDTLFKDQGEARQHVYEAVGEGFIADYFSDLSESEIAAKTDELALDAIKYLGKHEQELDAWKNN